MKTIFLTTIVCLLSITIYSQDIDQELLEIKSYAIQNDFVINVDTGKSIKVSFERGSALKQKFKLLREAFDKLELIETGILDNGAVNKKTISIASISEPSTYFIVSQYEDENGHWYYSGLDDGNIINLDNGNHKILNFEDSDDTDDEFDMQVNFFILN